MSTRLSSYAILAMLAKTMMVMMNGDNDNEDYDRGDIAGNDNDVDDIYDVIVVVVIVDEDDDGGGGDNDHINDDDHMEMSGSLVYLNKLPIRAEKSIPFLHNFRFKRGLL